MEGKYLTSTGVWAAYDSVLKPTLQHAINWRTKVLIENRKLNI